MLSEALFSTQLHWPSIRKEPAYLDDLRILIREGEIDEIISETFPLDSYGNLTENLYIKGSKDLVDSFNTINDGKMDIEETLGNISLVGFSESQLILRFLNDRLNATGTYNFTFEFLNELFHMGKFGKFCFENGYTDILRDNIEDLIRRMPKREMQYRLIKKEDDYLIRGLTSSRYNNYDNHLALYLTLVSLHEFAKNKGGYFRVEKAYLTDSDVKIFFEQESPQKILGFGEVYFSVFLSNNEIRGNTLSLDFRYKIIDKNGRTFSGIQEFVFDIRHDTGIYNVIKNLKI